MSHAEDLKRRMDAHRERSEQLHQERLEREAGSRPRRAPRRSPSGESRVGHAPQRRPRFQRGLTWVVVRPIRLGKDDVMKPGQLVPDDWPSRRLRRMHRSQQIGPLDSEWTEAMIRQWEDQVLARALGKIDGDEEREKLRAEWAAELAERRADRAGQASKQLEERRAEEARRQRDREELQRIRAEKLAAEEAERKAVEEAAAAEKLAEIEAIRQEEADKAAAEKLAARQRAAEEAGDEPPSESQKAALESMAEENGVSLSGDSEPDDTDREQEDSEGPEEGAQEGEESAEDPDREQGAE